MVFWAVRTVLQIFDCFLHAFIFCTSRPPGRVSLHGNVWKQHGWRSGPRISSSERAFTSRERSEVTVGCLNLSTTPRVCLQVAGRASDTAPDASHRGLVLPTFSNLGKDSCWQRYSSRRSTSRSSAANLFKPWKRLLVGMQSRFLVELVGLGLLRSRDPGARNPENRGNPVFFHENPCVFMIFHNLYLEDYGFS